jgi:hypothetical protein
MIFLIAVLRAKREIIAAVAVYLPLCAGGGIPATGASGSRTMPSSPPSITADTTTIPAADISQVKGHAAGRDYRGVGIVHNDASGKEREDFITRTNFDLSVNELQSWVREDLAATGGAQR